MLKLKNFLQTKPVFLYLLPVFFVLHGFIENFHISLAKESIHLTVNYLAISLLMASLFWFLFRNFYKASLISFFILVFNFFFGSLHDFLKKDFGNIIIVKYSFIITVTLLVLTLLIAYIKKTKKNITRFGLYLNCLLLLLITIEIVKLFTVVVKSKSVYTDDLSKKIIACDTCARPDIYLIIADEYAGSTELRDIFSFDNSAFENQLENRGFHLIHKTKSNYNATVYSMSSLFNMTYVNNLEQNVVTQRDMFTCRELIKNNNLLLFLRKKGYQTFNYSPFDFDDKESFVINPFFASKKKLFTSQTFVNRFWRDLGYHFLSKKKIKAEKDKHKYNNIKIDSSSRIIAAKKYTNPKFVYIHLSMPHHPYYFDSKGKESLYNTVTYSYPEEKKDYVQYLLYANKRLLSLIDHIKGGTQVSPIIILMSDHGYRQFTETVDPKYYFMTLNAVCLPNEDYSGFYDGMSNVNQFRILLNSQFGQKLPLLKDSTTFLKE